MRGGRQGELVCQLVAERRMYLPLAAFAVLGVVSAALIWDRMRPALAAVAIFTFMGTWNEFMKPLIYLSDARLYPLPLGLYNFSIKNATFFNMLMAASSLMTLPAVALFLGAQRYFIEGVTLTGMKG